MKEIMNYEIASIQTRSRAISINDEVQRDKDVRANLQRIFDLIDYVTAFGASEVKLCVLPEYAINARWNKLSVEDWMKISTTIPGPYTDLIAKKCIERKIYIAANMMEVHPDFPGRFFNCSFLTGPDGKILIKHWKNDNNAWVFPYTTPADIYTQFVAKFGRKALFPVAQTELGGIGLITCGELAYPEFARCTMMNGAEVLCHLTSEPHNMTHGDVRNWEGMRATRAYENKCYLAMANIGVFEGALRGQSDSHGDSAIHYIDGTVLNKMEGPGESTIKGPIDLNHVRRARSKPFHPMSLRAQMLATEYADFVGWPNDAFGNKPIESIEETREMFMRIVEQRRAAGIDKPPKEYKD
jgi:predicted amidohydrolase